VLSASDTTELFGTDHPARRYRELARALHPDVAAGADATAAFVRLTRLWQGRQGTSPLSATNQPFQSPLSATNQLFQSPLSATNQLFQSPLSATNQLFPVIRTKLGEYRLTDLRYQGDLADLYDTGEGQYLKLPRSPANNDLLEREASALRTVETTGDSRFLPYVPRLIESFRHRDENTGVDRRINVIGTAPNLHSLAEVHAAYPDGVDPRDVAWMWRRLLVALGFVHRAGLVHGAVLPTHVLIEPDDHGVVLVDWCYSAGPGDRIPALVPEFADWYPSEVHKRQSPGPGTDIAMAARCMRFLMGGKAPRRLRAFAAGCVLSSVDARPDDAWRLLDELDGVLTNLYGPRRFRPFRLQVS
jgi:hypothetical protein